MSKNIVFCADGTWNGPGQDEDHDGVADPTNVFKLFVDLDGADSPDTTRMADEQERVLRAPDGSIAQVAKYLHGVGDSRNALVRMLGGAGGAGLVTRIVRGYTFISRNYSVGDRIFVLGFSRGAYTARALAGLVAARGLIDAARMDVGDRDGAYRAGAAEWFEYRRAALRSRPDVLNALEEVVYDLPGFLTRPPSAPRVSDVTIEAVGVWDTVGALGIPKYNREARRLDGFQFADTKLSPKVLHGLHAVAVDERRADFTPTLWDAEPRIVQVLFPGAHSDVGGGYPQTGRASGLSDGAFAWMMARAGQLGMRFAPEPTYLPSPDPGGMMHEPWTKTPWTALPRAIRIFLPGLALHTSVLERVKSASTLSESGPAVYDPRNLTEYVTAGIARPGVTVV